MGLKKPLSIKDQIKKLETHGMAIPDYALAENILNRVSYYRFSGYALQFRTSPSDSNYMAGTNFETVHKIYKFDAELRSLLRSYIERVEIYFRMQVAHGFSMNKCMKFPHDQHYDEKNFYNKAGYMQVMEGIQREQNYYKDSLIVQHHKNKYGSKMPLWAIVELSSFSNLSKLYNAMYISEQGSIAKNVSISRQTLSNHLHCLSVMRNKCAHAARLYNTTFHPEAKFNSGFLRRNPEVHNDSLFSYLLVLVKRQPQQKYRDQLVEELISLIKQYDSFLDLKLLGFPTNYKALLKSIRFDFK